MDFNQLYYDHQVSLLKSGRLRLGDAHSDELRQGALLAGRIGCMQRALGASAADGWEALARADTGSAGLNLNLTGEPL